MRGRIMVGDHDGVYVLLFQGDVRLTLCTAVDSFLDRMFQDACFKSVVVDLGATESIDSTSLGLLAKLSIQADKRFGYRPTLVSTQPDITRVLVTMGLDDVFDLVQEPSWNSAWLVSFMFMRMRWASSTRSRISASEAA